MSKEKQEKLTEKRKRAILETKLRSLNQKQLSFLKDDIIRRSCSVSKP